MPRYRDVEPAAPPLYEEITILMPKGSWSGEFVITDHLVRLGDGTYGAVINAIMERADILSAEVEIQFAKALMPGYFSSTNLVSAYREVVVSWSK